MPDLVKKKIWKRKRKISARDMISIFMKRDDGFISETKETRFFFSYVDSVIFIN